MLQRSASGGEPDRPRRRSRTADTGGRRRRRRGDGHHFAEAADCSTDRAPSRSPPYSAERPGTADAATGGRPRRLRAERSRIEPDAAALQASFDQGHQPWQGDPLTKAELCVASAYGWRHAHGTLISANYVSVVDDTIGEAADVRGRRWRPGGDIWLVTSVQRDIGSD
jgi:hypothetical protein